MSSRSDDKEALLPRLDPVGINKEPTTNYGAAGDSSRGANNTRRNPPKGRLEGRSLVVVVVVVVTVVVVVDCLVLVCRVRFFFGCVYGTTSHLFRSAVY